MIALLLATLLLQAPNDLGEFLAALEKDHAKGTPAAELLQRIEAWTKKKRTPQEVARLEWNREVLKAAIWIDGLRAAWLAKRIGQPVTLANAAGVVKEAKADRVILDVQGKPAEIPYFTLRPDEGLAQIRAEKLLDAPVIAEAVVLFAAGRTDEAFVLARGFAGILDRAPCLRAFTGWALQHADQMLAEKKVVRAAEFLAAGWTPHEDLMDTLDGALQDFVRDVLIPPLLSEAARIVEKDRKEGRRVLDLLPKLTKSKEILGRAHGLKFAALDSNQWHAAPLQDLRFLGNVEAADGRISWNDPHEGSPNSGITVQDFPYAWDKISGIRAKVRPEAEWVDMRVGFADPAYFHVVVVYPKDGKAKTGVQKKRGESFESDGTNKIATKAEYLLRLEAGKPYWKIFVDSVEVKLFKPPTDPLSQLAFVVNDGTCELLSLEVRRK